MGIPQANKTRLYARAAMLITSGKPYAEVAKDVGVNRATLWLWRRDPLFLVMLDDLQEDALHAYRREIRLMIGDALQAVRDALSAEQDEDDVERNKVRLAAAKLVLDRAGLGETERKLDELDDAQIDEIAERVGWRMPKVARVVEMPQ